MGTIYRFITRTVLYNILALVKNISSFVKKLFFKYRQSIVITLLIIAATIVMMAHNPPANVSFFLFTAPIVLIMFCGANLFIIIIQYSEGRVMYELKIIKWGYRMVSAFTRDVARPLDAQEELDRKRNRERKDLREEKKRLVREARKIEQNKYDRFEVMEMD